MNAEVKKAITADQLTAVYIKLRDRRAERKKEFEAADTVDKEKMDRLEAAMLKMCNELNTNSMNTDHGTILRSIATRYSTSDWESFDRLILEQQIPQLLERRIAQKNMKQFLEEHPDLMPHGLNVLNEYTIVVRRSKNGKPD